MRPTLVARIAGLTYLYHVYISIDSPDPEIYRTILGGSLKKALLGLQTLIDGLSDRVALTVSSVAMPDLLRSIGIRTYHLQGLHDRTSILADDDLRRNSAGLESVREIRRRCAELGIHLESSNEGTEVAAPATSEEPRFSAARTRQCLAPWDFPFVDREGRVFPGDSCRDGALASIG